MGFNRRNGTMLLLLILLLVSTLALGWTLTSARYHLSIMLGVLITVEIITLYGVLTRTNRDILFFFRALENDDTSICHKTDTGNQVLDELNLHLSHLNQNFSEMKLKHELGEQYFNRILENLSSGLMVISKTGFVNHINKEALKLFEVQNLTHVKALREEDLKLHALVEGMKSGMKGEITLQLRGSGIKKVLGLQCTGITLKGEDVRVFTIQDLSVEMEQKEIEDWIRLIRIMSHEIMNSLAPITSISTTLKEVWSEAPTKKDDRFGERIGQTIKGLDAIAEQSEGLTTFFESYRVLSRIPDPDKKEFPVYSMFEKLETLVVHDETSRGIKIVFRCEEPTMKILADEQMIIQVMLNLVKNASQAVREIAEPAIEVATNLSAKGLPIITVRDNGIGIPDEIADEVFLPFFTTGEKGTGVGLSYSRLVMNLHGGLIRFNSQPGSTEFALIFG